MRFSDVTQQQMETLIAPCSLRLMEHHRGIRWTLRQVMACLVAAGFCACGTLWAVTLTPGRGLEFLALAPWYFRVTLFGLIGAILFVRAWLELMMHEETLRAGERAYLMLLFEKFAKENIEFSAEEVVAFLRSVPDSMSLTKRKPR